MKNLLILTLMLGSLAIAVPAAEAKTAPAVTVGPTQIWDGQPRRNRRWRRSVIRTRIVRIGYRTYRERYRITYLPNGRTRIQVISRVRIR